MKSFLLASGSEGDNLAIQGIAFAYQDRGKHIITSNIEHHAVLHTCEYLEKSGFEIELFTSGSNGDYST